MDAKALFKAAKAQRSGVKVVQAVRSDIVNQY
jgi:hypothetical protein